MPSDVGWYSKSLGPSNETLLRTWTSLTSSLAKLQWQVAFVRAPTLMAGAWRCITKLTSDNEVVVNQWSYSYWISESVKVLLIIDMEQFPTEKIFEDKYNLKPKMLTEKKGWNLFKQNPSIYHTWFCPYTSKTTSRCHPFALQRLRWARGSRV